MKKIFIFAAIAILASGCTSRTEHGECIGAFDEGVPDLQYKLSIKNTVLAVLFSETIFVPVIVVANEARCPVGKKVQK